MISTYTLHNAGPRTIYRPNQSLTKANLDKLAEDKGKTEEEILSQEARLKAAETVLNSINFYA